MKNFDTVQNITINGLTRVQFHRYRIQYDFDWVLSILRFLIQLKVIGVFYKSKNHLPDNFFRQNLAGKM